MQVQPLRNFEVRMSAILKATNLTKTFKSPQETTVLDGISLEVYPGDTIAIVGKSGEGKTTLLHLLGVLEEPTSGTVEICGEVATPQKSPLLRNSHIGFVFQAYHLLEECTVLENVLMPARIAKHFRGQPSKTRTSYRSGNPAARAVAISATFGKSLLGEGVGHEAIAGSNDQVLFAVQQVRFGSVGDAASHVCVPENSTARGIEGD